MPLPELDELTSEVERTCAAAHTRDASKAPDPVTALRTAAEVAARLEALAADLVEEYVEHCRTNGASWSEIGQALGVTRQAAQQRFLTPSGGPDPAELSAELRRAMGAIKSTAVRQRHNYIATEHVLGGLLAEDNSATRLLVSKGVAVDDLRRAVEARLTLGSSHAAERISWTPHARRALALARDHATRAGSRTVGCDDLVAGLLELGRGVAADVLAEAGLEASTF